MVTSSPISAILGFMHHWLFDPQGRVPNVGIAGAGGDNRPFGHP
jgi:hypothetical protein